MSSLPVKKMCVSGAAQRTNSGFSLRSSPKLLMQASKDWKPSQLKTLYSLFEDNLGSVYVPLLTILRRNVHFLLPSCFAVENWQFCCLFFCHDQLLNCQMQKNVRVYRLLLSHSINQIIQPCSSNTRHCNLVI